MRSTKLSVLILIVISLFQFPLYAGQKKISYQGKLTDASGNPIDSSGQPITVTFRLYNIASGGTALWAENQGVVFAGGLFNATLGSNTSLDSLPFNEQYYLGIQVAGDQEMEPRQPLSASAYSLGSLGDFNVSRDLKVNGKIQGGSVVTTDTSQVISGAKTITSSVTITTGEFTVGGSSFTVVMGKVGIGTNAPVAKLDVTGGIGIGSYDPLNSTYGSMRTIQLCTQTGINGGSYDNHSGALIWSTLESGGWGDGRLKIALGNGWKSYNTATPAFIIGQNVASFEGNLGIGISNPQAKLHLFQGGNNEIKVEAVDGVNDRWARLSLNGSGNGGATQTGAIIDFSDSDSTPGTPGGLSFVKNGIVHMYIKNNGYVGIGDIGPDCALDVVGEIRATGAITPFSDDRLKKNTVILDSSNMLTRLCNLQGIKYQLDKDKIRMKIAGVTNMEEYEKKIRQDLTAIAANPGEVDSLIEKRKLNEQEVFSHCDTVQIGLSAQELEKRFPELVRTGKDGYKSVAYDRLSVILLEGMKEQQKKIEELEARLRQLEASQ